MYESNYLRRLRPTLVVAAVIPLTIAAGQASAEEWIQNASVGADLGVGSVITRYSPSASDGGSVLFTSVRGGYDVREDISLNAVLRLWALPGANYAVMPGLGVRIEPFRNEIGRAFLDFTVGVAWTSNAANLGFDTGGGFEFDIPAVPGLALGPVFRYGQVVDPAPRTSNDGRAWELGAAGTFHFGRAAAGAAARKASAPAGRVRPFVFNVPDTDHDGVTDDADQCPQIPAGRHRDPIRPGCPENDEDGDEITDSDDLCPLTPAGDHPDPKRKGCPYSDTDGDGIADSDDRCPDQSGPASTVPAKNGCPAEPPKKARRTKRKPPPPPTAEDLSPPTTTQKRSLARSPRN
jgi:hypothetical protein